jgi:TonB family protein
VRAVLLLALLCLDREGLTRQIRRQLAPVRRCYERKLAEAGADTGGRLVVRFVIEAEGSVAEASVVSSDFGAELDGCVVNAVMRWRFPKPPGGGRITVTYPFIFKPG